MRSLILGGRARVWTGKIPAFSSTAWVRQSALQLIGEVIDNEESMGEESEEADKLLEIYFKAVRDRVHDTAVPVLCCDGNRSLIIQKTEMNKSRGGGK